MSFVAEPGYGAAARQALHIEAEQTQLQQEARARARTAGQMACFIALAVVVAVAGALLFGGLPSGWAGFEDTWPPRDREGLPQGCTERYVAVKGLDLRPREVAAADSHPPLDKLPDISDPSIGVQGVKTWAKARVAQAEADFKQTRSHLPSPDDWATSVIYNVQIDRFNNGNLDNDRLNLPPGQQAGMDGGFWDVAGWRHGGDLDGVRQRLEYIKDLGANTLWMTPVLYHDGAYHGYCTSDLTEVDPGFGTNEDFRDLVREAHKLGIRVVMDVVVNHLCDNKRTTRYAQERREGDPVIAACANRLMEQHWEDRAGEPVAEQADLVFSDSFFPPMRKQEFFARCGPLTEKEMQAEAAPTVFGDFTTGFFDYDTRNNDWQEIFTDLHKYWIAFADVDGFRCDAAKHVSEDFLAYFATESRAYAESIGKENFLVLGEVASDVRSKSRRVGAAASDPADPRRIDADIGVPRGLTRRLLQLKGTYEKHKRYPMPSLGSVYNFYMSGKARDALAGEFWTTHLSSYFNPHNQEMTGLMGQQLGYDCCMRRAEGCTGALPQFWTLLEIHDWPRFQRAAPDRPQLGALGFAWLLTAPGQPIIHYGQEQGFTGLCPGDDRISAGSAQSSVREVCSRIDTHELFRQDMFESGPFRLLSSVEAVSGLAYIGQWTPALSRPWREDPMLNREHSLYRAARQLARLRASCPVLVTGLVEVREAENARRGLLAFSRILRAGSRPAEALVVLNPSDKRRQRAQFDLDSQVNTEGKRYVSVLEPAVGGQVRFRRGQATLRFDEQLRLEGLSYAIFMDEALVAMDPELGIALCREQ